MNFVIGAAAAAAVLYFLTRGDVTVEKMSDVMRKVIVDGRAYLVTRLGGGLFNVTKIDSPLVSVTIDQVGEKAQSDGGKPEALEQLRSDMKRFPNELFKN